MQKFRQYTIGIAIGVLLTIGSTALANTNKLPSITDWVKFKFNDIVKEIPEGYTVISYDGRMYVPARFIAEELGASVDWNKETQTILIKKERISLKDETDIVNQEVDIENSNSKQVNEEIIYEELPVSITNDGVRVEVYSVGQESNATKVYIKVKNTSDKKVQLNQESAYFQSETETYKHKDIKTNILYWKDITWFNDLDEDKEAEGYITLPPIPEDETEGKFYVEVIENNLEREVIKYNFNLKW